MWKIEIDSVPTDFTYTWLFRHIRENFHVYVIFYVTYVNYLRYVKVEITSNVMYRVMTQASEWVGFNVPLNTL